MQINKIHCDIKTKFKVVDLKLNHKFLRILLTAVLNDIELYEIPEIPLKDAIEEPKFIFKENNNLVKCVLFNPFNTHIIASSSYDCMIKIWSIRRPTIKKIYCLDCPEKMKWETNGKFLGFIDKNKIKIYSMENKKVIFDLELKGTIYNINYEFFDHQSILVSGIEINKIYKYKIFNKEDSELKVKHVNYVQYDEIFEIKYKLFSVCNDYFIIYSENGVYLYDDNLAKPIYTFKDLSVSPKKITNADKKILFEILDINNNNIKILTFKDKYIYEEKNIKKINNLEDEKSLDSKYDSEDNDNEDLDKDFFEGVPKIFLDIKEILNFQFNKNPENYNKKEKQYFQIKEIKESLNNIKINNLITLRKRVKEDILKITNFKNIKELYFFYLDLLLKDETNKVLLLNYLKFLKENEKNLDKENLIHEKFIDELNYYSIFFDKEELKNYFDYDDISEKDKLLNLLYEYSLNINNKSLDTFKIKIENKYIDRNFNQPLSYNSKEIIYYRCNEMLIQNILYGRIKKENEEKEFTNKNYIIKKILEKDIINNLESIDKLLPLISLITYSEDKSICDFYINLINSKKLSNSILNEKVKQLDYKLITNKNDIELIAMGEVYKNPEQLCFENIDSKFKKCEKYNYDYLIENPPLKLDINRIKEFLVFVLNSNVFMEAFELLTGNKHYKEIFNKEMINEYVNNIKFLPIKYSKTSAFIDTLSLITFIPTMKKSIINNSTEDLDEIIVKTLENSVIVEIIFHEFGHAINSVLSFIDNKLKPIGTPRKKFLKFKEGGYYLELLLFGKIINNLSYGEALYILNLNNYNKSLDDFKNGFEKLSIEDLKISGLFKDLNLNDVKKVENLKTEVNIKAKIKENENFIKNIKIRILPKNDILNREINEEDLKLYY